MNDFVYNLQTFGTKISNYIILNCKHKKPEIVDILKLLYLTQNWLKYFKSFFMYV